MTTSSVRTLREKVMLSCRMIGSRGVSRGSFGHVSARIPDEEDRVLIKSKGPDEEALEFTTERDIITVSLSGELLEAPAGLQAPAETAMHLAIYRARPEIMSVIHSHPLWVVLLTACDKPLVGMYGAYDGDAALRLLDEGVPTFQDSRTITDDALAAEFMAVMENRRACLLRGHGMTVCGASVEDATASSLTLHDLAQASYMAYAIGTPMAVPDLDAHRARWRSPNGRRDGGAVNAAGESFTWRYNKRLLGA
jgi:ribulose-5-phosphate 4-epimerase/fuculose-1-phosphate aldolase